MKTEIRRPPKLNQGIAGWWESICEHSETAKIQESTACRNQYIKC